MAVALIYFVGGIMTDKLICHSLKDPHNSRTFHLLDKLSNIERFYKSEDSIEVEPVNLRSIIRHVIYDRFFFLPSFFDVV